MTKQRWFLYAIILLILLVVTAPAARADETVWVICQPDSMVNIRRNPSGRSEIVGFADPGDSFTTDGLTRRGFLHVYASIEGGEGWISTGYIVNDEPIRANERRVIEGRGRVKARRTVNGKRRCWLKPGDEVTVYFFAEWCVTSAGFVYYEFIGG